MTGGSDSGAGPVIRVLLADDHPVVRAGLRGMLAAEPGIEVVGEAGSGPEAVALARAREHDVILMDLRMPLGDGLAATEQILAADPEARVLVLTTYDNDADILRAVEAGAAGYLLKDTTPAALADGIRAAARGGTVLAPSVAERLVTHVRRRLASRCRPGKPRSWPRSRAAVPTPRSAGSCSSARRRSRRTCCGRSASWACPVAPRR